MRWLLAAGLAFAAVCPGQSVAQPAGPNGLSLDLPAGPHPHPGEVVPFFTMKGGQRDCAHIVYDLRFGARGDSASFLDPAFIAYLESLRMDFSDRLPSGLTVVGIELSGDGTDAAGGPLPAGTIRSTASPDDTAELVDFRLSAADLDGIGASNERYVDIRITARIEHPAFPVPAPIESQGVVAVAIPGAPVLAIPSHDPNLPDDADFLTGAPTAVLVDLSGCQPPQPPPGGKPCFEAALGAVDCAPGGGVFTWHMPVGADLAGKWVELATTTPGVTIAPAMQLVAAGGGTLDWTIDGAMPGDVVNLVITGLEPDAGPGEGIELCCTQTLDIVIPAGLDCPEDEAGPDLEVESIADAALCQPDGSCGFTIRVGNAGTSRYVGPIVIGQVTAPGKAAGVTGPGSPWTCQAGLNAMRCTHPETSLDPGEWKELKLGFTPGPGWKARFIRSCARYDYAASGKRPFGEPVNDRACATIPVCLPGRDPACTPPAPRRVDLAVTKQPRREACTADGFCDFVVRVFNRGSATYEGPLVVVDTWPAGAPASSDFGPAPWSCSAQAPGAFRCEHPGVALPPGGSVALTVRGTFPDGYGQALVRNCAELAPVEGDIDPGNGRACAGMRIPGQPGSPDLRIAKSCGSAVGGTASCRFTVSNHGSAAPLGPVRVVDTATGTGAGLPLRLETVTPDGAEWNCGPVPAEALACRIAGELLGPGASRHVDVTVAAQPGQSFQNCARGLVGPAPGGDVVRPFGKACAEGGAAGLRVWKTGDTECRAGEPCTFEITIANDGPQGFSGPVRIGDAIGIEGIGRLEGLPIDAVEPPFGCSPAPSVLPLSCIAELTLEAGESRVHRITVTIPDDGRLAGLSGPLAGRNCIGVLPPGTEVAGGGAVQPAPRTGGAGSPYACHLFTLLKETRRQCSAGFVLNSEGRCICPPGTAFRSGRCRGQPVSDPPVTSQCRLLPGQIRTETGQCVCPAGTALRNGRCVADEPPQCRLLPGQVRTSDGRCVCRRGTDLRNGRCVADEPPECRLLPGQVRTSDGRCVCPRGTDLRNGRCVADEPPQCRLLPGQVRTSDGRCLCRRGTELRNGRCVADEPPQCRLLPGQVRTSDGRCVCPRGTELVRGACRQRVTEPECPGGTRLVRGRCRRIGSEAPTLRIDPNLLQQVIPRRLQPRTNDRQRRQ